MELETLSSTAAGDGWNVTRWTLDEHAGTHIDGAMHATDIKGDMGSYALDYLVSEGEPTPYRLHIRPPSFVNLQVLPDLLKGLKIGDVIAVLGSTDIVLGEVDR